MSNKKLVLYHGDNCPYCDRVIDCIKQHDLDVSMKNITHDQVALQELIDKTGRYTIPCLFIDEQPMHESRDIITWLKQNV